MHRAQVGRVQGQVGAELAADDVVDGAGPGMAAQVADIGGGQYPGPYPSPWPARGPARAGAAWQWRTLLALERAEEAAGQAGLAGPSPGRMALERAVGSGLCAPTVGRPSMLGTARVRSERSPPHAASVYGSSASAVLAPRVRSSSWQDGQRSPVTTGRRQPMQRRACCS